MLPSVLNIQNVNIGLMFLQQFMRKIRLVTSNLPAQSNFLILELILVQRIVFFGIALIGLMLKIVKALQHQKVLKKSSKVENLFIFVNS